MKKLIITTSVIAIIITASISAQAYSGELLVKQAHITLGQARTIALNAFPGTITDEELEKEHGGSGLRYSFDIKQNTIEHEVGVDAKTGKVLENGREVKNPD